MRIALIAETVETGVGRHVADLMRALCLRGHEVHLLHGTVRCDPRLLEALRSLPGAHLVAVPMARAPHPRDVKTLWTMARYLRRNGPFDVLHGHSSKGGAYARLLGLWLRVRSVYTPHALVTLAPDLGVARWVYGPIEWALARLTDTIICCSENERAHALALGLGADRCVIVPHGLEPFQAVPLGLRERGEVPPQVLLAGFVGRLAAQKAPEILVDAMIALHRHGAPVHLAMAGDGPLRKGLEQRLRDAGAQDSVSWLGPVEGRRLMAEIDVLVMPSRYEGFPYVLLEALNCGVPVVATPVGGVMEALAGGRCGIEVPHDDPAALVRALESLLVDAPRRAAMSAAARAHGASFTIAAMVARTEAIYRGARQGAGRSTVIGS